MQQELTSVDRDRFFSLSLDMLCISSGDGYFKWLNPAFAETLGWSIEELLKHPYSYFVHPDDLPATLHEVEKQMSAGARVFHFENRYRHKDGSWRVLSWMSHPQGNLMYAVARDVTSRKMMELALLERVQQLAERDPLTGLANRTHLRKQLGNALSGSPEQQVAVLWIELSKFQELSDVFGQPTGDSLLIAVAARLRACIGEGALIGRNDGDKFLVVQIGKTQPSEAAQLAHRIFEALRPGFEISGAMVISAEPKIGIAISPADGSELEQLLDSAHLALLRAKSDDEAQVHFFAPKMDLEAKTRRALETDLSLALRNGELEVHYQPIVNLATRGVTGAEALLRWRHPKFGNVAPAQFIPIAEASGAISMIGEWVLQQACRDATMSHIPGGREFALPVFGFGRFDSSRDR